MWEEDLIRKLVVNAPHDLLEAIYARGLRREGPSWPEIVRAAQALGIFTAEEAVLCLQLTNREGTVINSRSPDVLREEHPAEDPMEQIAQGISGMKEIINRFRKEIQAISEEALAKNHEASVEDLRRRVAEVQDRMYGEACEMYDRLVAESMEIERELTAKIGHVKETMQHVTLLKEVITFAVKPGGGQETDWSG